MPWGPWRHQLLTSSEPLPSALDDIQIAFVKVANRDEVLDRPIRFIGTMRYSEGKLSRFSQEIRIAVEVIAGIDDEGVILSVSAQGGDQEGKGSLRGIDRFKAALQPLLHFSTLPEIEMTATEYKTRLEFGIHLETVKQLVVEHGHTYVSNNAPDDYKLWRDNLLQRGEDPDAF